MLQVSDAQRRARLGVRQGLAPRTGGVLEAVEATTCLHATEPATVYLSVVARSDATREQVADAMYVDRSVVRQLAMRRTMFVFPRELMPHVWGAPSARVAQQLAARLAKEVETHGVAPDGVAWVEQQCEAVLHALAEDGPATTIQLRDKVPALGARIELGQGKKWGGTIALGPRLLTVLAARGGVLRGENEVGWRVARHRWTLTEDWLGEAPEPTKAEEGYRELVRRWLRSFGPGTEDDLVWWLGATKAAVRAALVSLEAVAVALEPSQSGGATGYLLPDDLDDVPEPEPWAALLPVLDPATMGWKQRDFYLDPEHRPLLFDSNGNAGTTAWWNGRVVGSWVQDADGTVRVVPLGDPGADALAALDREAERLSAWLDGDVVSTVYPSALMKQARAQ